MIFSTSFLNKSFALLIVMVLAGCSAGGPQPLSSLRVNTPKPSVPSPQPAMTKEILWSATSDDGVGGITYEFLTSKGGVETLEQRGPSPTWTWVPRKAGTYKVKIRAWDGENQVAESGWTDDYVIRPTVSRNTMFAFLPVNNLSNDKAPLLQIEKRFVGMLTEKLQILPDQDVDSFMRTHRMRYVGGIGSDLAEKLRQETGAEAVFITSLETWGDGSVPRVSLHCRLVTTGAFPEIIWMDNVGVTGDDDLGLLGIGRVTDIEKLLDKALLRLCGSLWNYLDGMEPSYRHPLDGNQAKLLNGDIGTADNSLGTVAGKHQPSFVYRASFFEPSQKYNLALFPFLNINTRKYAEEIAALHLLTQLYRYENIKLFEPGLIREKMLQYRMIIPSGPSFAAADVLANKNILGADLIVSGQVFDYQDRSRDCKFDFSVLAYDGLRREIVWASRSSAQGNDDVYFFDFGKILSASNLVSLMTRAVVKLFLN